MKVLFVSSTGGHFAELLKMEPLFAKYESVIVTERTTNTKKNSRVNYFLKYGTRAHLIKYLWASFINLFICLKIFYVERPNVIVSTGAHTAFQFFLFGKLFGVRTIYVESYAKVNSKSLTYKLSRKFLDEVIVQHHEMEAIYPEAKFFGGIY
ncbi:MAG: PssD/Cps14F family polysaccharide biosynthesis glycosyltransferase [Mycoplasmatales bacterium]